VPRPTSQFIPEYFKGIYGLGGNFALVGVHMWYLWWLFWFSLITLPLLVRLKDGRGSRLVAKLAAQMERPGAIFVLGLPLCVPQVLLNPKWFPWGLEEAGWFLVTYLILLVYGFVLAEDEGFRRAIARHWVSALILGGATNLLILGSSLPALSGFFEPFPDVALTIVRTLGAWFWLVALLGFADRYLSFANHFLAYAAEAVLPFYMLHQTIIVIIGFFIRNWQLGMVPKYIFLSTTAFSIIMLLYEFVIRRNRILRVLFGMRPERT
jgi:peptidoglycan/LPS O-acetylase OafA/YrhL